MDVTAELSCRATPDAVFAVVSDLGTYGSWLDIVSRAVVAEADHRDAGPAWSVDLRGQLGPLRRTKRLRMVRTVADPGGRVVFERFELDGRRHSDWVLSADLVPDGDAVQLTMRLHYGGNLWVPVLDRLLADEIERSSGRLAALVET